MTAQAVAPDGTWLTAAEAAATLRVSPVTIIRMFADGDIPGHRARSAYRFPAAFVADLLTAIGSGRSVDIREFGRQWRAEAPA
jgi:excisionase family DNA binding protein